MSDINYLSDKHFQNSTLNFSGFAVLECLDNTAGSLQIMEPVLIKLRKQLNRNVAHLRINTDAYPEIREKFFLERTPAYLLFDNGTLIDRVDGMVPFWEFMRIIENHTNQCK